MVLFPHAKINLGLNIIRKREDGYHDVETCFYPIPWTDILEIIPAKNFAFTSSGLAIDGNPENNLCVKAYTLLKQEFNLPAVHIHLHKIIPMGAGLGGGSSDAAFTLLQLNQLFELNLSFDRLKSYAATLGSDCAFFIEHKPKLGTSRGEVLSDINVDLKGKFIVVVKPPIHVSTADAYAGVVPSRSAAGISTLLAKPIQQWRDVLKNDFEESIFKKHPTIRNIKHMFYEQGAIYASMSGSGSSVFGIFDERPKVEVQPQSISWSGLLE